MDITAEFTCKPMCHNTVQMGPGGGGVGGTNRDRQIELKKKVLQGGREGSGRGKGERGGEEKERERKEKRQEKILSTPSEEQRERSGVGGACLLRGLLHPV